MWSALLSLAAVPALAQAFGIPDDNRMVQEPGLLRFPLAVSEGAPIVKNITKRQSDISLESQQTGWFYTIDLVMGTPGQTVKVNFDTGSAELWVNAQCSTSSDPEFCATFPRFTGSSTLVDLQSQSTITYGSGSVDIEYSYDFVSIGGARISQQIFGVGTASEILTVGIMGAGPDLYGWESPYPLPIDNLFTQGFINHRAFSLDMRSIESSRGSVIYGGLDTKKYSGHLEARPIIPASSSPDQLTRYWIYVDGIALTQADGTKDTLSTQPLGVLLDSGYTVSALPSSIFNVLLEKFPTVQPIPGSTLYEVDCSVGELDGTVDFTFGETVIKVPYNDFIWKQPQYDICILGAFLDDEFPVLGDSFLRAAYVVYDWDNRVIHLANNEDCGSNLVAFGTGVDAIPDIVGECGGTQETTTSEMPTSTSTTEAESTTETTAESTTESSTEATTTAESTTALETDSTTAADTETTTAADTTTTGPADSTTTLSFSTTHYYNTSSIATSTKYTDSHTTNVYPTNSHTTDGYATGSHTTSLETLTSTITATNIYTITSCAPTVTNCPVGSVTTEVVTSYTTYCPGEETKSKPTKAPVTSLTSTYTSTRTYTVTDCHGKESCTKGALTTEVYTSTTMVCPQTTATYTLHQTIRCPYGQDDCMTGSTKTIDHVFTIYPVTEYPVPTPVPGCSSCVPPANNATATYKPTYHASDKVPSYTAPVSEPTETISVVTGAAAWNAPGLVAVAMGVLLAAAI